MKFARPRRVRLPSWGRCAAILVPIVAALLSSGCGLLDAPMTTLDPVSDWGKDINRVYLITTVIVTIVFFAVAIPIIVALVKFRERPGDTRIPKQVAGNHVLELMWTIIPVVLLAFIAVPTWHVLFKYRATDSPDALNVVAIGHQWWWEFHYPSLGITTANELHLPEGTQIAMKVTSADVIHSFWVPRFGGKIDALPGVMNSLLFTTPGLFNKGTKGGEYYQGQCMELCGSSHALMRFETVVHSREEFAGWSRVQTQPPTVETTREKLGEKLFVEKTCFTCHTIYNTVADDKKPVNLKSMFLGIGIDGKMGPNLSSFGNRRSIAGQTLHNTAEEFHRWLENPPGIKPGSKMLNLGLKADEIDALSAYVRNATAKTF